MKVVKWTEWDDSHYMDVSTEEEFEKARQAVIEELQKTGYHKTTGKEAPNCKFARGIAVFVIFNTTKIYNLI